MNTETLSRYPTYPVMDWSKETIENRPVLDAIYARLVEHGFARVTDETDAYQTVRDLDILRWKYEYRTENNYHARVCLADGSNCWPSIGWQVVIALARSIDQQIRDLYETGGPAAVQLALDRFKLRRG